MFEFHKFLNVIVEEANEDSDVRHVSIVLQTRLYLFFRFVISMAHIQISDFYVISPSLIKASVHL